MAARCAGPSPLRLFEVELPAMLDEARPVLMYFAGHGTATSSLDEPRGYLASADGGLDLGSLLPMEDVARAFGGSSAPPARRASDCRRGAGAI